MWSKVISNNHLVTGWTQLTQEYWVTHGDEPFTRLWEDPSLFKEMEFNEQYYYTSISCPYLPKGGPHMAGVQAFIPKYKEFITAAKEAGFDVKLGVIGRDQNILRLQQQRVRGTVTTPHFLKMFDEQIKEFDPVFVSTELLYLYKRRYLKQLEQLLDFPVDIPDETLSDILSDNANGKYIQYVEHYWLDDLMKAVTKHSGNSPYKL
jgi:hypothetical protein